MNIRRGGNSDGISSTTLCKMETSPTPPVTTIPSIHGRHMPETLRQRHPDSVPCLFPLPPPPRQTTTLTRMTSLMELGSQQMRLRSRSQGPLPRTPLMERTQYIAFLIPKTNWLFTDRYQLVLRSFVNFVTQGYKGTVGSSREFQHLMTKEVQEGGYRLIRQEGLNDNEID